jgi:membrane protein
MPEDLNENAVPENDAVDDVVNRLQTSIWRLGGLNWSSLLHRVWVEVYAGHLLVHAAALAFYFLFAIFPLLIFLVNVLGLFVSAGKDLRASLIAFIKSLAPSLAFSLIASAIDEITTSADLAKLVLGGIAALWFGSLGVTALSESLNAMYGVRETRSWLQVRAAGVGLTIILLTVTLVALLLTVYAGTVGRFISGSLGQGESFGAFWTIAQIPIAVFFVLLTFAIIYYFAPDLREQKWYWITPGSVVGVLLWLCASVILSTYLRFADSYSVTYGSLAGVIVLMLWFYVTGSAILIGGKINAEIEHAAARAGFPDAKLHGERDSHEH